MPKLKPWSELEMLIVLDCLFSPSSYRKELSPDQLLWEQDLQLIFSIAEKYQFEFIFLKIKPEIVNAFAKVVQKKYKAETDLLNNPVALKEASASEADAKIYLKYIQQTIIRTFNAIKENLNSKLTPFKDFEVIPEIMDLIIENTVIRLMETDKTKGLIRSCLDEYSSNFFSKTLSKCHLYENHLERFYNFYDQNIQNDQLRGCVLTDQTKRLFQKQPEELNWLPLEFLYLMHTRHNIELNSFNLAETGNDSWIAEFDVIKTKDQVIYFERCIKLIRYHSLTIDLNTGIFMNGEHQGEFSTWSGEFKLLELLLENQGSNVSFGSICKAVYPTEKNDTDGGTRKDSIKALKVEVCKKLKCSGPDLNNGSTSRVKLEQNGTNLALIPISK